VQLVVPSLYIKSFPEQYRPQIMTLGSFVNYIKGIQD